MGTLGLISAELATLLVYMTLWFAVAYKRQRLDTVDTAWGGGFIVIATISLVARQDSRTILAWLLVAVWGARLAIHIWRRGGFRGPDRRYDELSSKWRTKHLWQRAYFSVFLLQGLLIFAVAAPITISALETNHPIGWLEVIAAALWASGFIVEALADRQLSGFLKSPSHKGKIMQAGLWHYSRHPNYFGELVQWWGISVLGLGTAIGWLGLIGPLILTTLIVFISGIPSIEKRRQGDPEYEAYKRRTSVLIPWPPKPKL